MDTKISDHKEIIVKLRIEGNTIRSIANKYNINETKLGNLIYLWIHGENRQKINYNKFVENNKEHFTAYHRDYERGYRRHQLKEKIPMFCLDCADFAHCDRVKCKYKGQGYFEVKEEVYV